LGCRSALNASTPVTPDTLTGTWYALSTVVYLGGQCNDHCFGQFLPFTIYNFGAFLENPILRSLFNNEDFQIFFEFLKRIGVFIESNCHKNICQIFSTFCA
jgi:hypothetical protein